MTEKAEIIQISDKEYLVKNNTVHFGEDNIVYVEAIGEQSDDVAMAHFQLSAQLNSKTTGKLKYLINLNGAGKNSPMARKMWQGISESDITDKVALYGIHPVAKVLASFVMGMTKRKNIRFFNSKKEATDWLKS